MELPPEIWEKIIVQIKDPKQCIKLFQSFPKNTKNYIRDAYNNHMESIQMKILYAIHNCIFLAIEDKSEIILMDDYDYNEIQYVRSMKGGIFVSVDEKGEIIFWDEKTYKYIDSIEIENNIQNIEFHPNESRLVVSFIHENIGIEFQSILLKNNQIEYNQTILAFETDFLIEIIFHPTSPYVLFIRHKNYQIYSVYLWKYNEKSSIDEFEYSPFERVEFPFVMNFGVEYMDNFIYIYYLPFRILDNGDFECLGKGVCYYYILKMGMANYKFYQKENEKILYYGRRQILDYIRIKHKIIYLVDGFKIIEQDGANTRIIYQNNEQPISQLTYKNNYIIFLEKQVFKKINIDKLDDENIEEIIDCQRVPNDFCIL